MGKKMKKIEKPDEAVLSVRVPRDLDARMDAVAVHEERTKASLIRIAIREYLEKREVGKR